MGTLDRCTAEMNEFENGPGALVPGPGMHALTTSSAEPLGQGRVLQNLTYTAPNHQWHRASFADDLGHDDDRRRDRRHFACHGVRRQARAAFVAGAQGHDLGLPIDAGHVVRRLSQPR